ARRTVDRTTAIGVPQDQVEDRVEVRLFLGHLDSHPRELDRRLEELRPGNRSEPPMRSLQPGDDARNGDRSGPDAKDLRKRTVEVDADGLHLANVAALQPGSGDGDEEVQQARSEERRVGKE